MKIRIPLFLIAVLIVRFALLPIAQAAPVPNPPAPGVLNTRDGQSAMPFVTTGVANSAFGAFSQFSITTGNNNTAVGVAALDLNNADNNTAVGTAALLLNTAGSDNTAVGTAALLNNTMGVVNTAVGSAALRSNTDGNFNTAVGQNALVANTSGQENTAVGNAALANNPPGNFNTAVGSLALLNTTGTQNTGIGRATLGNNTTGSNNTAVGDGALFSSTGSGNIALGAGAGGSVTTASNVTCIGASGANVDNSCFIGRIYFNVQPIVGTDPDSVTITSAGRLGRGNVSSRRYKHDIKAMDNASEAIFKLKPVSFRYNKQYDAAQTLAFGLIAEEVAEVYPDLVGRNPEGEPESVRYEQINAMLLNEFLKEHLKVEELEAAIAALRSTVAQQRKDFEASIAEQRKKSEVTAAQQQKEIQAIAASVGKQAAQIQKVSMQVKLSRSATRLASNKQ